MESIWTDDMVILSRQERRFLLTPSSFGIENRRQLKYRLREKIKNLPKELELLSEYCQKHGIDMTQMQLAVSTDSSLAKSKMSGYGSQQDVEGGSGGDGVGGGDGEEDGSGVGGDGGDVW